MNIHTAEVLWSTLQLRRLFLACVASFAAGPFFAREKPSYSLTHRSLHTIYTNLSIITINSFCIGNLVGSSNGASVWFLLLFSVFFLRRSTDLQRFGDWRRRSGAYALERPPRRADRQVRRQSRARYGPSVSEGMHLRTIVLYVCLCTCVLCYVYLKPQEL